MLLQNGNVYGSITVAYLVQMKQILENRKELLKNIQCKVHKFRVCDYFKFIGMILGQQTGVLENALPSLWIGDMGEPKALNCEEKSRTENNYSWDLKHLKHLQNPEKSCFH